MWHIVRLDFSHKYVKNVSFLDLFSCEIDLHHNIFMLFRSTPFYRYPQITYPLKNGESRAISPLGPHGGPFKTTVMLAGCIHIGFPQGPRAALGVRRSKMSQTHGSVVHTQPDKWAKGFRPKLAKSGIFGPPKMAKNAKMAKNGIKWSFLAFLDPFFHHLQPFSQKTARGDPQACPGDPVGPI